MLSHRFDPFVRLVRPENAAAALLSLTIGFVLGKSSLSPLFFLSTIVLLCLHSAGTIQNDQADLPIDRVNAPQNPLPSRQVSPRQAWFLERILFLAAWLVSLVNFKLFIFTVVMTVLTWSYNNPPFSFSRKPVASIVILGAVFSLVPMLYGFLLTTSKRSIPLLLTILAWFLLRMSTSVLKDYKDVLGDRQFGKRTGLLVFGKKMVDIVSIAGTLLAYIIIAGSLILLRGWHIWNLFLLPFMLYSLYKRLDIAQTKDNLVSAGKFSSVFLVENQLALFYLLLFL